MPQRPEGDIDANTAKEQLELFKEKTKQEAEELVSKEFPKRILVLNNLLDSPEFNLPRPEDIHTDVNIPVPDPNVFFPDLVGESNAKKRKHEDGSAIGSGEPPRTVPGSKIYLLPNGTSPSNTKLLKLMDLIKPLLKQLVSDANLLKMWISFLIPKIEDGNNFGVSIQEDTLGEIRAVESEAAAFYDGIARYFSSRASVISKMIKYPHVDDYRQVIQELDEKEYFSLRLCLLEVRNHYALMHDIIFKNYDKIRKPRSQNVDNLY